MADVNTPPDTIVVKFVGQNETKPVQFRVKKTAKLFKMFDAYSKQKGMELRYFRFTLDGQRLNAEDTAESAGLENEDVIDVFTDQVGG